MDRPLLEVHGTRKGREEDELRERQVRAARERDGRVETVFRIGYAEGSCAGIDEMDARHRSLFVRLL
jgi:hypothetical protein